MPEKDAPQEPAGPSLELPSLGFGRKRRAKKEQPAPEPVEPPTSTSAPEPAEPRVPAPEPGPVPETAPEPVEPQESAPEPVPQPDPEPASARGAALFTDERATEPLPSTAAAEAPAEEAAKEASADREPARRGWSRPALPQLGPVPATLLTGLLVGVITVGLVWASQRLCEVLRGTSSCGNAGFLLLLAVLVLAGLLGASLLKAFGVEDGGSTSFLAMGLVAVVLMLVLADQLFAWWMVLAVPAVAMVAYVVSQQVTTAMVEPGGPEVRR